MIFVMRIGDCSQEAGVSGHASDVLRRAGVLAAYAVEADRLRRVTGVLVLDDDHVMPVIAEIVHIVEGAGSVAEGLAQRDSAFVDVPQRLRFSTERKKEAVVVASFRSRPPSSLPLIDLRTVENAVDS